MGELKRGQFSLWNIFLVTVVCAVSFGIRRAWHDGEVPLMCWAGFAGLGALYGGVRGLWRGTMMWLGATVAGLGIALALGVQIWYLRLLGILLASTLMLTTIVIAARTRMR